MSFFFIPSGRALGQSEGVTCPLKLPDACGMMQHGHTLDMVAACDINGIGRKRVTDVAPSEGVRATLCGNCQMAPFLSFYRPDMRQRDVIKIRSPNA